MCIVSLLKNGTDFILTHNRDENIHRKSSKELQTTTIQSSTIQFPEDIKSNGTWICSSKKYVVALLNGAFYNHTKKENYRTSRGKLIFELFCFHSIADFVNTYNFQGIEPFTMLAIDVQENTSQIIIWNEIEITTLSGNTEKGIVLLSSTLYSDSQKSVLKNNFSTQVNNEFNHKTLFNWHYKNRMKKNKIFIDIQTVSITQIIKRNNEINVTYQKII